MIFKMAPVIAILDLQEGYRKSHISVQMTTECGIPPAIPAGQVDSVNDTAVKYKCLTGYAIQGYDVVLCEYGEWSQDFPSCVINWRTQSFEDSLNITSSFERAEVPEWLLTMWAVFSGVVFLSFTLCFILLCIRLCWCCRGKAVAFGGTFRYSESWMARNCFYCCKCEYKKKPSRKKQMLEMMKLKKKDEDTVSLRIEEVSFRKSQKELEILREKERKARLAAEMQKQMDEQTALLNAEEGHPNTVVEMETPQPVVNKNR